MDNTSNAYSSPDISGSYERETYTISELAKEFAITTRAIRFYEDAALISPARRGRNRIYSLCDRTRLKLILRGKRLGFSLGEIREMFQLYDSEPGEIGQLHHVLGKVTERMSMLEKQLDDIGLTLQELQDVKAQCQRRLQAMEAPGSVG